MFHFLESASPYYFGTTDLTCIMKSDRRKREVPNRNTLEWAHRFIYYKGYYFEFGSNSKYNFVLCLKRHGHDFGKLLFLFIFIVYKSLVIHF